MSFKFVLFLVSCITTPSAGASPPPRSTATRSPTSAGSTSSHSPFSSGFRIWRDSSTSTGSTRARRSLHKIEFVPSSERERERKARPSEMSRERRKERRKKIRKPNRGENNIENRGWPNFDVSTGPKADLVRKLTGKIKVGHNNAARLRKMRN